MMIVERFFLKTLLLTIFFTLNLNGQIGTNLELVWQDEFEGNQLDTTKWQPCPEWKRQNFCYWEADNNHLTGDGQLRLDITEVNGTVYCGAIRTRDLYAQKYGYFETRCKVPKIKGGWVAFWMMPNANMPGNTGKDGTEIDVFESINGWKGMVNHALHWDGYEAYHQSVGQDFQRVDLYDDNFHTFGVMWTPTEYIFYIDGAETWRSSAGGISEVEQYLKLTIEVTSAAWAGNWSEQTEKPIYWYVDYVRAYQFNSTTLAAFEAEKLKNTKVSIYPNPTKDVVVVTNQFKEMTDYKLVSRSGQEILKGKINSKDNQINISHLPADLYMLVVGNQSFKIIKE